MLFSCYVVYFYYGLPFFNETFFSIVLTFSIIFSIIFNYFMGLAPSRQKIASIIPWLIHGDVTAKRPSGQDEVLEQLER